MKPDHLNSASVLRVIVTSEGRGDGTQANPYREVFKYWSFDGDLLAENDTFPPGMGQKQ
jgi:hypothetical protein